MLIGPEPDERQLISQLKKGDTDAAGALMDLHGEALMRYLYSIMGTREAATECPGCRAKLEQHLLFCPHCGRQFRQKCSACGAIVEQGHQFCGSCGADLTAPRNANA